MTPPSPKHAKIQVHVQPNAKKNEIIQQQDGSLKIKITAPPQEGKANRELIAFLAQKLKIKKNDILLAHGETSKSKLIEVKGLDKSEIIKLLLDIQDG